MPQSHNQKSFHSGEWAPALTARVDLAKYQSAASLLRNWFVDYRGGASTRMGTRYILQCFNSDEPVFVRPFSASFNVGYALEFGNTYIRFYHNGAAVLEAAGTITNITQANPAAVSQAAHGYGTGEWVFITGVVGMTQVNGRYFRVVVTGAGTYTLQDLNGVAINSTAFTAYASGGAAARVYTLPSPYLGEDLSGLKFAQNVNTLVITHLDYVPYVLTLISATNWTLTSINFGASINAPSGVGVATTLGAGTANYSYEVTAVDANGQESTPSTAVALASKVVESTANTTTISWTLLAGALSYNVYKSRWSITNPVPTGQQYGYIGTSTADSLIDTAIPPDFSECPPIAKNPFQGGSVSYITVTAPGTYTSVPTVTLATAPAGGQTATAAAVLKVQGTPTVGGGGVGFVVGDAVFFPNGVILIVATVGGGGVITAWQPVTFPGANPGSITLGSTPTNPVGAIGTNSAAGNGGGGGIGAITANLTWGVGTVQIITNGAGYLVAPAVTFSAGAATATAALGATSAGNPSVCAYFNQRLVLAAPTGAPQTFYMSIPGSYYNFNVSDPVQADDAITGTIVSKQLNSIQSMVPMPNGLIMLGAHQAWQVSGGSSGAPVTPIDITAQAQAYNGASGLNPIVANFDILYVQSKGSVVRDLAYDFYKNIYTGTDISVLSSHLFFGYTIADWAFAEEPFKIVWACRNDGELLSLTFLKEQEIQGWAHSDTQGSFLSVATVTETVDGGSVDAPYFVVERELNAGVDPSYQKVMLHFDGADGSTTITDSNTGGSAHTWTANGNAQIDTAIYKFGYASGLFDGTGDYVTTPDSVDFSLGSGDFTIDFWFNVAAAGGTQLGAAGQCDSGVTAVATSFIAIRTTINSMAISVGVGGAFVSIAGTTPFTNAVNAGWHHMALTRSGDVLRMFIDGIQEGGNVAIVGSVNNSTNALSVGRLGEATGGTWNGSIDEFRMLVGYAQWTSNFTTPNQPYDLVVKYIERMADRFLDTGVTYAWCVDAGLRYDGVPATSFSGGEHLAGLTVTGLADGVPITPFVMGQFGTFTLAAPASVVTVGLAYMPQLKTMVLDLGEPTVIGKLKKIVNVTIRAIETLGITFGRTLSTQVPLKDFSGAVNSQGVTVPYALTDADAFQIIDAKWDQDGQYYIEQPYPLPATILGVVPEIKVEDRK